MITGKNYLDQQQWEKAIPLFEKSLELEPGRPDAHLNLANAYLLSGNPDKAVEHAQQALSFDRNLAAAYYVAACGYMRLGRFTEALQMLQSCRDLDPEVAAVHYHLGVAHQELGHYEDALAAFQETIRLDPKHPAAHYALSRALLRTGRQEEAQKALESHNRIRAELNLTTSPTTETLERCKYTQAVAPQQLVKPHPVGIKVKFVDATSAAFGSESTRYHGPIGVLDYNHDDRNSLFVAEGTNGFRLLDNRNGVFRAMPDLLPAPPDGEYKRILVGDLNNDRFEDLIVIGERVSLAFRFATNGVAREWTAASGLKSLGLVGSDAVLLDMDFTGKLDILAVQPGGTGLRALRNLANMYYKDVTATSGVPAELKGAAQMAVDDWNNDDMVDVIVSRKGAPPVYLQKIRGGPFCETNLPPGKLEGHVIAIGDVNGDSRADLVLGADDHIDLLLGGVNRFRRMEVKLPGLTTFRLLDYDNDGWLDLFALGNGLWVFRNVGDGQFKHVTENLGFKPLANTRVNHLAAADFDTDGDTDLVLDVEGRGLQFWRNEGGNANLQLKLRLLGNRSNASGLGIRLEVAAGPFRVHRTVSTLPVEIGIGKNKRLDSLTARWFDLAYNQIDITPDPKSSMPVFEPVLPAGSCPYVYAWDGEKFRFVSDFLGSSPVGLRVSDTVFAEADPHEYLWLGSDTMFKPRAGNYTVQITEELREVLYLDEAKLVVVDHPPGTEVHTTDKFRPRGPFPRGELWTLENRYTLHRALTLEGTDVTHLLMENDGRMV
ncbi:MAG: tetratricopeptide repeat protein, partial [Verrucomicrobiae bacterium]|nr:tetratricopeptide repeat protein [Verrucomicrobiae bacterium]